MPAFDTEKDLLEAIMDVYKKALREVGKRTKAELHDYVEKEWYLARPESTYYQRTRDFINSITLEIKEYKTIKNKISVHVFFDIEKIKPSDNVTFFGSHQSFDGSVSYQNKSIGWHLVSWIEEGINPIRDDGYYVGNQPMDGIGMILATAIWLEDNLPKIMKPIFKRYGLPLLPINVSTN